LHDALLLMGAMTEEELRRAAGDAPIWLEQLAADKRAGQLAGAPRFWVAAERLPMIQAVYPKARINPLLTPPASESKRSWERADAVRELARGRMEAAGPMSSSALAAFFQLPLSEIEGALLALEAEGFVLRGKFHPDAPEMEWCDRRLLARIHRLTINRLRAEIQPVTVADFQRFLLAWQRVAPEQQVAGVAGLETVLTLLDGYELPAAAWEPEVLAARVKEYQPQWLDQLCFTGRVGWGRLTPPQNDKGRPFAPVRSSPVSLFTRDNLRHWFGLSPAPSSAELAPDTQQVLDALAGGGALFFGELVKRTRLLPSRVEQGLAELTAQGCVTADSFEGLRALLLPQEKRAPFAGVDRKRRHKTVTSVEFAGRWSLLRTSDALEKTQEEIQSRDEAAGIFAQTLLRRYGVVFRRLLERESLKVPWFELSRVFRRLEARGEIRGGYFVGGVSGEQFALPEAIGLLRSIRKAPARGELIAISAADPLNFTGILTPGPRIPMVTSNRILLRDGEPVAALQAGQVTVFPGGAKDSAQAIERMLVIGKMSAALRPYYT
jgi:ATP-dependent helicase Lhr and Lhr-like helicase